MVLVAYIPNNDISILQTKLSNRERHEARGVGLEAMPLDEDIEGGHGAGEARLHIRPHPRHRPLQMTDQGQPGEHRFHQPAVLPLAPRTQFEVGGVALGGVDTGITQDEHASVKLSHEPWKGVLRDMGGLTRPCPHSPPLVQHPTPFAPDHPARMRETLAAHRLGTPTCAPGMDQLAAVGIKAAEHRRSGQEGQRPGLRGPEEAQEPRPLGEPRDQRPIVARQPAIERPVAPACEGLGRPQVPPALGQRWASGCLGIARSGSSIS